MEMDQLSLDLNEDGSEDPAENFDNENEEGNVFEQCFLTHRHYKEIHG